MLKDVDDFRRRGYDDSSIEAAQAFNRRWRAFEASPLGEYLASGTPAAGEPVAGGNLLSLESIAAEVEDGFPGSILFANGLLPIWSSIGGNLIAYHPETHSFYWADHGRINNPDQLYSFDGYEELPFSVENLFRALYKLSSDDCAVFLADLRRGRYTEVLERLD